MKSVIFFTPYVKTTRASVRLSSTKSSKSGREKQSSSTIDKVLKKRYDYSSFALRIGAKRCRKRAKSAKNRQFLKNAKIAVTLYAIRNKKNFTQKSYSLSVLPPPVFSPKTQVTRRQNPNFQPKNTHLFIPFTRSTYKPFTPDYSPFTGP